jgi:simple sugar transport system permease protein
MLFGSGLAFYLGKPLIQPQAPQIPAIPLGAWSHSPAVQAALAVNALFPVGLALAALLAWGFANTRFGLVVRMAGDSTDAARALGYSVNRVRIAAGLGGASLSLYYPGSWNEGVSSGPGLIAVALVIFARWRPVACLGAALLFGGAGAIGPALQSVGLSGGYHHLVNAVPYALTLVILVATCSPRRSLKGAPVELKLSQ